MMIDSVTHLHLHRQGQDERHRHLRHRAAIRATQGTADAIPADVFLWRLRGSRRSSTAPTR